jgi:hypothetical protein
LPAAAGALAAGAVVASSVVAGGLLQAVIRAKGRASRRMRFMGNSLELWKEVAR